MTTTPNDPTAGTGTENLTTDQKLALFLARVEEAKARFDLTGIPDRADVPQYVLGWTDVLHYLAVGELDDDTPRTQVRVVVAGDPDEAISRAVRDLLARGEGE
ncbi:MAG: hypothetical protein VM34scaffold347_51 [Phage 66_12]|nr:MAG: hypothetical protein VM34scaffold347_51 [Phage 66_12]